MFFFLNKVNERVINEFYLSLKMKVKVVSINMKSGTLKMIFLTISHFILFRYTKMIFLKLVIIYNMNR